MKVGHELLKMLEDRLATWAERQTIADVFVCLGPYLATYTVYVVNYPKALVTLNDKTHKAQFAAFLKRALEQGAKQYQTVASYLIMPVQRIPRYQLLLRELLRVTPEAHPDHRYLTESLERMTELAVKINETIREEEELEKVIAIQKKFTGNPVCFLLSSFFFSLSLFLLCVCTAVCGVQAVVPDGRGGDQDLPKEPQAAPLLSLLGRARVRVCERRRVFHVPSDDRPAKRTSSRRSRQT